MADADAAWLETLLDAGGLRSHRVTDEHVCLARAILNRVRLDRERPVWEGDKLICVRGVDTSYDEPEVLFTLLTLWRGLMRQAAPDILPGTVLVVVPRASHAEVLARLLAHCDTAPTVRVVPLAEADPTGSAVILCALGSGDAPHDAVALWFETLQRYARSSCCEAVVVFGDAASDLLCADEPRLSPSRRLRPPPLHVETAGHTTRIPRTWSFDEDSPKQIEFTVQ